MISRFRMIAGPNGSGKTSLVRRLRDDYAVNFYDFLNADDMLAEVRVKGAFSPKFPVVNDELISFAVASSYGDEVKRLIDGRRVRVVDDCIRFDPEAVNSYTIALVTNFLQDTAIRRGFSFSQETVFSHPSKVDALRRAFEAGYRTYLYFVSTDSPDINLRRISNRIVQGGHDVPNEKVVQRYGRSLAQVKLAIPYLSRAFFFDNSGHEMRYIGDYSAAEGYAFNMPADELPRWFARLGLR